MSPITYLIALPIGIIAISGWMVKMENDNFLDSRKSLELQRLPGQLAPAARSQAEAPLAARFDHDRYGMNFEGSTGSNLGEPIVTRSLGSRPSRMSWLEVQSAKNAALSALELPDIPGYVPVPENVHPYFQPVPIESGFHITADEATKVDMAGDTVVFNGNVSLTSPQFNLSSTSLTVHMGKDSKTFNSAEAHGRVHVQLTGVPDDKKYRGQSQVAVYDPKRATITLTGWPRIQGQGREIVAVEPSTRVILYPDTGKMITEGRAQSRIAKQFVIDESPAFKNP